MTENKLLGLLVPPGNVRMESDFRRRLPGSVDLVVNRLYISEDFGPDPEAPFQEMADHVGESARLLAKAKPELIVFGCTTASYLHGAGWEQEIGRRIQAASNGIPAISAAQALVQALRELDIQRVAVGTPYDEDSNQRLKVFLAGSGFAITSFEGHAPDDPDEIYQMGLRIDRQDADGLFLSCTAFRAWEVVERLERQLDKPVVTSNQASMWLALRCLGVEDPVPDAGRLFRKARVPAH